MLFLLLFLNHISGDPKTETGTRFMGDCWDRPDHVRGRTVEESQSTGLEKPLSLPGFVSSEDKNTERNVNDRGLVCEVSEEGLKVLETLTRAI